MIFYINTGYSKHNQSEIRFRKIMFDFFMSSIKMWPRYNTAVSEMNTLNSVCIFIDFIVQI